MLHLASKTRDRIVGLWFATFLFLYYMFCKNYELESIEVQQSGTIYFDAVVYVAMGKMAAEKTIDLSILSLRKHGNYAGAIYVVTDSPNCFEYLLNHDTKFKLIQIPKIESLVHIKALKTQFLNLLPLEGKTILYIDADIIVSKPLNFFGNEIKKSLVKHLSNKRKQNSKLKSQIHSSYNTIVDSLAEVDMGAFYDSGGHYVGYCDGCEKWHTGVLLFQRRIFRPSNSTPTMGKSLSSSSIGSGKSASADSSTKISGGSSSALDLAGASSKERNRCLMSWEHILLSGKYNTDQESLDEAERIGDCTSILPLPSNHLLFAKDYLGFFFKSGHTFIHITGAGRLREQSYFYREIVVPRFQGSLHLSYDKSCTVSTVS